MRLPQLDYLQLLWLTPYSQQQARAWLRADELLLLPTIGRLHLHFRRPPPHSQNHPHGSYLYFMAQYNNRPTAVARPHTDGLRPRALKFKCSRPAPRLHSQYPPRPIPVHKQPASQPASSRRCCSSVPRFFLRAACSRSLSLSAVLYAAVPCVCPLPRCGNMCMGLAC
jgi:hypothetical protein